MNILMSIYHLFSASQENGYIPRGSKISKIKMIYKSGWPKTEINLFRQISLLSCIAKWLEKIINKKQWFGLKNTFSFPTLNPDRTLRTLRKNRSCQDHILLICQNITKSFNKREKTFAVFFDLEKTFDKASHEGIILMIENLGINQTLLKWIKSFLSDRHFLAQSETKIQKATPSNQVFLKVAVFFNCHLQPSSIYTLATSRIRFLRIWTTLYLPTIYVYGYQTNL